MSRFRELLRILVASLLATGGTAGCSKSGAKLVEGSVCAIPREDGGFQIVKVLAIDERGVHLRMYSDRFESIPARVDERGLSMKGPDRAENEYPGMGHIPLSNETFSDWGAIPVQVSAVLPEELEGYEIWRTDERAGYF